jgi:hypothetical protein
LLTAQPVTVAGFVQKPATVTGFSALPVNAPLFFFFFFLIFSSLLSPSYLLLSVLPV